MNIEQIAVSEISFGDRLRKVDPDYVALLKTSISEDGIRQPIELRKSRRGYILIAGAHRLTAARELEFDTVPCLIKTANETQAKLLEIDENLFRRDLSVMDRSAFLAERKAIYEELYPETKAGGDRRSDQNDKLVGLVPTFTAETAEKLGCSGRSIERAIARFKGIDPDIRRRISGTWLENSGAQLDLLSKMQGYQQDDVAKYVEANPNKPVKIADIVGTAKEKAAKKTALEQHLAIWRKTDGFGRNAIIDAVVSTDPVRVFAMLWAKASEEDKQSIIEDIAPLLPGFSVREAA
ncbi:chromosome partitioning nuclease protein ParB [Gluconobacter frateurii M-2]|nr:chromosome partitioning nuclease protein ParB [Gluconobacter frateurii M-2]